MGKHDDSESEGSTTSVASTSTVSSVSSRGRTLKRPRHDDSLAEELDSKCKDKRRKTESKRKGSSSKKKKETGVKPSSQSALQRQVALGDAVRLKELRDSKKSTSASSSKQPQKQGKNGKDNVLDNILSESELTPRKRKLMDEIRELRQTLASGTEVKEITESSDMDVTLTAAEHNRTPDNSNIYLEQTLVAQPESGSPNSQAHSESKNPDSPAPIKSDGDDEEQDNTPKVSKIKLKKSKKQKKQKKKKQKKSRKSKKSKKGKKKRKNSSSSSSSTSSSSSSSSSSDTSDEETDKKMNAKRKALIDYSQLLWKGPNDKVQEIVKGSGIFMDANALAKVMGPAARSHSSAARLLCKGVFTTEALCDHSVLGFAAKGPKGKPEQTRSSLCPIALDAVHTAAKEIASSKKFQIKSMHEVNTQIGTMQSEIRAVTRK